MEFGPLTGGPPGRQGRRNRFAPRAQRERGAGRTAAGRSGDEWLYGRNGVRECLRAGRRRFKAIALAAGSSPSGALSEILENAERYDLPVREVDRTELDELTRGANHQGIALRVAEYPYLSLSDLIHQAVERPGGGSEGEPVEQTFLSASNGLTEAPQAPRAPSDNIFLVLDSLQDPQNFGTLLRTAEAVGVRGVVIPAHRAVAVTPAVVNASAGASEHLRIARVANLARALDALKEARVWVIGLEAAPGAVPLWEAPLHSDVALVVGGEGEGIRRLVLERCDIVASLPLLGQIESLNAAVAGSVALYEALRRRL